MNWSYGIQTCADRLATLLPRTLVSLRAGGFDKPRLFIDGTCELPAELESYDSTCHFPAIRTYGNWVLALAELYIRNPSADRYAIFQDDCVCSRNLREYLERTTANPPHEGKVYWNCYAHRSNETFANGRIGWNLGAPLNSGPNGWQTGRGAVGLVFIREGVQMLLCHQHMVMKPAAAHKPWKSVDGAVVTAMNAAGWRELVHYPSLLQHTGDQSSMGNRSHQPSQSFRGEDFDLMELVVTAATHTRITA